MGLELQLAAVALEFIQKPVQIVEDKNLVERERREHAVDADLTSGLAGPWIGMPATRTPFTVPPAANSRRHWPSLLLPPAHVGMRGSPFIKW
jgi:hypothetical protein